MKGREKTNRAQITLNIIDKMLFNDFKIIDLLT